MSDDLVILNKPENKPKNKSHIIADDIGQDKLTKIFLYTQQHNDGVSIIYPLTHSIVHLKEIKQIDVLLDRRTITIMENDADDFGRSPKNINEFSAIADSDFFQGIDDDQPIYATIKYPLTNSLTEDVWLISLNSQDIDQEKFTNDDLLTFENIESKLQIDFSPFKILVKNSQNGIGSRVDFTITEWDKTKKVKSINFTTNSEALMNKVILKNITTKEIINANLDLTNGMYAMLKQKPIDTNKKLTIFSDWIDGYNVLSMKELETFSTSSGTDLKAYITGGKTVGWEFDLWLVFIGILETTAAYSNGFENIAKDSDKNLAAGQLVGLTDVVNWINLRVDEACDTQFTAWKSKHPSSVNEEKVNQVKAILHMTSAYHRSSFAVAGGDNSFNEIYLPYYFESLTGILGRPNASKSNETFLVKVKSKYYDFTTDAAGNFVMDKLKDEHANISEYKIIQTDRYISQPTLPQTVEAENQYASPSDIDTDGNDALKYPVIFPISSKEELNHLFSPKSDLVITQPTTRTFKTTSIARGITAGTFSNTVDYPYFISVFTDSAEINDITKPGYDPQSAQSSVLAEIDITREFPEYKLKKLFNTAADLKRFEKNLNLNKLLLEGFLPKDINVATTTDSNGNKTIDSLAISQLEMIIDPNHIYDRRHTKQFPVQIVFTVEELSKTITQREKPFFDKKEWAATIRKYNGAENGTYKLIKLDADDNINVDWITYKFYWLDRVVATIEYDDGTKKEFVNNWNHTGNESVVELNSRLI